MAFSFRAMDLGGCGGVGGVRGKGLDSRSFGEDFCLLRYNLKHVNGVLAANSYFSFTPNGGGYLCVNVNATPAVCDAAVFDWTMEIVGKHKCITRVNLDRDLAFDAGNVRTRILQSLMVDMYWIKDARLKNDCGLEICTWRDMNSLQVMQSTAGASYRGWANPTVCTVRGELMMAVAEDGAPHSSPPRLHRAMARRVFLKTPLDCSALSDSMYGNRRVGELVVHTSHLNVDPQRFFDVRDLVDSMPSLERVSWIFKNAPTHYGFLSPLLEACKSLVRVDVHVCEYDDENGGTTIDESRRAVGAGVAQFLTEALMRYQNAYFVLPMTDFELKNSRLLRYHTRDPAMGLQGDQLNHASAVMSLTFEERGIGATKHRYHDRVIVFRSPASCAAVKKGDGDFRRHQPPSSHRHSRQQDYSRDRGAYRHRSPERGGTRCYNGFPQNFFQTMDANCLTSLHLDRCTNYRVLTMAATYVSMKNVCQITHLSFNGMITYVMLNALQTNSSVRVVGGTLHVQTRNELNALTAMLRANKTLMCVEELVMGEAALSASAAEFEQLSGALANSEKVTRVGVDSLMRHPSTAAHATFILDAVAKRVTRPPEGAGGAPNFVFSATTPRHEDAQDVSTLFHSRNISTDESKKPPGLPPITPPQQFVGTFSPHFKRRLSHEDSRIADEFVPNKVVSFAKTGGETSLSVGAEIEVAPNFFCAPPIVAEDTDSDSSGESGKLKIIIPDATEELQDDDKLVAQ